MCGIAGVNRVEGRSSIPDLREFARQLAYAVESRGRHATGFGWEEENVDGAWPYFWKSPGTASRVAKMAPLPVGMRNVIVHCRHATHGLPSNNANNHPVTAPGIVLVHNGKCSNYGDLIAMLGYERKVASASVDSEAIAALLSTDQLGGSVPDRLTLVEGSAALAWIDAEQPGVLNLARLHGRPLAIARTRRGDFVFASTPEALMATARATKVTLLDISPVAPGTFMRVKGGVIIETVPFDPPKPPPVVHHHGSLDRQPGENASQHASRRDREWEQAYLDSIQPMDDTQLDDYEWRERLARHGNLSDDEIDGIVGRRRKTRELTSSTPNRYRDTGIYYAGGK